MGITTKKSYSVHVGPENWPELEQRVNERGLSIASSPDTADLIMWFGRDPNQLVNQWSDRLVWLQLPDAGIEKWLVPAVTNGSFLVTSAAGAYGRQVAEHALALILAGYHGLTQAHESLCWEPELFKVSSLNNKKVLIIGAGGIGLELSHLLSVFPAEVTLASRSGKAVNSPHPVVTMQKAREKVADFDVVVLACPSTNETRGMVNSQFLSEMSPHAQLINVARGDVVVTADLVEALQNGVIAFAGLDVVDPEPLPDQSPMYTLKNCILTPHVANPLEEKRASFMNFALENIDSFLSGKELKGVVSQNKGY